MKNLYYDSMDQEPELHSGIYAMWKNKNLPQDLTGKNEEHILQHIEELCRIFNQEKIHPDFVDSSLHKKAYSEIACHQKLLSLFPNFSESPHFEFYQWLFCQADLASEILETDYFQKLALKLYRCKTLQRRLLS